MTRRDTHRPVRRVPIAFMTLIVFVLVTGAAGALYPELGGGIARWLSGAGWSEDAPKGVQVAPSLLGESTVHERVATAGQSAADKSKPSKPPKDKPQDPPPSEEPTPPVDPPIDPEDPPVVPEDPPTPPSAPGTVTAVSCVSGDMADIITFAAPADGGPVAAFQLLRSATSDGDFSVVATVGPEITRFVFSVETTGTPYYKVATIGPGGGGPVSEAVTNAHVSIAKDVPPSGAALRSSNGEVALVFPAGAYDATTTVTIEEVDGSPRGGIISLAGVYDIKPSGTLAVPARLSVAYVVNVTHFQVVSAMLAQASLMSWDGAAWASGASNVTAADGMLSGDVSHFSYWTGAVVQPHGTSATTYCSDGAFCHNLSAYPDSAARIAGRDSQICYNCHGNTDPAAPPAGATGENVQGALSGPSIVSKHPVATGDLYCTACHDPHADPAQSPGLLRSIDALTGVYVQGGGGVSAGNAFCWTCHGTVSNRRTNYLVPNYWANAGGDKKTGYATSAHASLGGTAGVSCTTTCHKAHGAQSDKLVPARQYTACTGGTGQACHSDPANAVGGSDIEAQLSASANNLAHHDVSPAAQAATGARIECTSCHNVHRNSSTQPIADPDNPQANMALSSPAVLDSNGSVWMRVGAEHDAIAPTILTVSLTTGMQWSHPPVTWITNEPATSWVEWGTTTAYGSTAGNNTMTTGHTASLSGLAAGVLYHYRVRSTDALGNTSYSGDFTYTPIEPPAMPVMANEGTFSGTNNGNPADVVLDGSTVTAPDGHTVQYQFLINGTTASGWLATPSWATQLYTGNYTAQIRARDSVHTAAISDWSIADAFTVVMADEPSGSCPFLYTWDGTSFSFEGDLMMAGKLGNKVSTGYQNPNPQDAYVLRNAPAEVDGTWQFRMVEERFEVDYIDRLQLFAADVPDGYAVYAEKPGVGGTLKQVRAQLHTVRNPVAPVSAIRTDTGQDISSAIAADDDDYVVLNEDRENFEYKTIELDLGDVSSASQVKLLIDGVSAFFVTPQGTAHSALFGPRTKVEVQKADGTWYTVPSSVLFMPVPPEFARTYVFDITKALEYGGPKVRLTFLYKTYIDMIKVDTSNDQPIGLVETPLVRADLRHHGIDARSVVRGDVFEHVYGPENGFGSLFSGDYTRYGAVGQLLAETDDKFVVMGGGDEIDLAFTALDPPAEGMTRQLIVGAYGYYKDKKTDLASTVDPLPFSAMSAYPYPATEHYPDDSEHVTYLNEWNTRAEAGAAPIGTSATGGSVVVSPLFETTEFELSLRTLATAPLFVASTEEPGDLPYSVDTDQVYARISKVDGSVVNVPLAAGWQSSATNFAAAGPTPSSPGTPVDAATMAKTSTRNAEYWRTDLASVDLGVNWQLMRFDMPVPSWAVRTITLVWYGHGEPTPTYELKADVWNPGTSTWTNIRNTVTGSDTEVTSTSANTGSSAYCIRCHDGAAPAGVTFPAGGLINVGATWSTTAGDYHGGRSGSGTTWIGSGVPTLVAGNTRGSEVPCGSCHASHGSASVYHIPGSINGSVVPPVTGGTNVAPMCSSCHIGTVSQLHDSASGGCNWCHGQQITDHGVWIPSLDTLLVDCLACHKHGASWTHTKAGAADCWNCASDHGTIPPSAGRTF